MQDEEVNRAMNAVTPKSSPLPTPKHKKDVIEVLIPPNIQDPLLLTCNDNEEYEKQLFPLRKTSKRRNKKKRRACSSSVKEEITNEIEEAKRMKTNDSELCEVVESSAEKNPSERIQPTDSEMTQDKNSTENKVENSEKDKNKGNVGKIGKIGNKLEREDKNKLRLKGLEEPKDKRLRKVMLFNLINVSSLLILITLIFSII